MRDSKLKVGIWGGCLMFVQMQEPFRDLAHQLRCILFQGWKVQGYFRIEGSEDFRIPIGFQEQVLRRNVRRVRGGLAFKAHRLLYHSTLGSRVIKRRREDFRIAGSGVGDWGSGFMVWILGSTVWDLGLGVWRLRVRVWDLGVGVKGACTFQKIEHTKSASRTRRCALTASERRENNLIIGKFIFNWKPRPKSGLVCSEFAQ